MNGTRFQAMVRTHAPRWLAACFPRRRPARVPLVMDYEKCLRTAESLRTLRAAGLHVVKRHPKYSPDLNAIEGVWHLLRQHLDAGAPAGKESRPEFVQRLRGAVRSLNTTHRGTLLTLCTNQQTRAQDVLALEGALTKW